MKIRTLVTMLFFLFNSNTCFSQEKNSATAKRTINKIEAYLDTIEKAGFMGTVLVELNGEKVISSGYGYSDLNKKIKNNPNTLFDIGSITKQFTAAAILKLEMQGKLTTSDKISIYYKSVPKDKVEITIHDLLRHQSGLPSNVGGDYDKITESAFIDSVLNALLKFEPGKSFSYSNIGYSLLAIIIEKVSGLSYEQYLYANLWKPAGMEFTGYTRPKFNPNTIATGYYKDDKVWGRPTEKEWDINAPYWHLKGNGGILSTTEELYKWSLALLTNTILSNAAKEKYYHPQLRVNENNNPYYAYGWDVMKTKRNTILVQHNGSNGIFYADFKRFIDEGITIIMLSNKSHPNFNDASMVISNLIFDSLYKPIIPIADNPANRKFTEEVMRITIEEGLESGIRIIEKQRNRVDLLEVMVNSKGYELMNEQKLIQAIDIFKLNVYAYPASFNAYDSLGEAYLETGNKELAIENYKKSLLLNPDNLNAVEVLKEIEGK